MCHVPLSVLCRTWIYDPIDAATAPERRRVRLYKYSEELHEGLDSVVTL
jgi:hypothetical protein